ncbi:MAG: RNA polymerase sigma factor [Phycisphaerae bacterium]
MQVSDATLVIGTLSGDKSAFAELYDRRARVIRAICYDFSRDATAAADLTQETFLRAWRNLNTLRDPERFGPWLIGIARQVCNEWRRGRYRRIRLIDHPPDDARTAADRFRGDPPDEALEELRLAIAKLPEDERTALHGFYLQEMDVDRARSLLGTSRSGLYALLARARDRLRRALSSHEVKP